MYNTFECHFKPNHKKQSDMVDPVHVAQGPLWPVGNATKLRLHFFEPFLPCENKLGLKKNFYRRTFFIYVFKIFTIQTGPRIDQFERQN